MPFLRIYVGKILKAQYELTKDVTRIGRSRDNDIVLPGRGVSKHHAVIEKHGNRYVLKDRQSANGTFVNGERVSEQALNFRDEIQILENTLVFMPVAKRILPKDEEGSEEEPFSIDALSAHAEGLSIKELSRLMRHPPVAQLLIRHKDGTEERHVLKKSEWTIGRSSECDTRTGGWLAPRIAARVQHRPEGYFLHPERGRVYLNDQAITEAQKLQDGDRFSVGGLLFKFYFRPLERRKH